MRHHGVELALVQPLEESSGDPDAGVAAVVAERERIRCAVVDDAEVHERDSCLPAPPGDDGPQGVVGLVAAPVGGGRDPRRRDQPLHEQGIEHVLHGDQDDRYDRRDPDRHAEGNDDASGDHQDRTEGQQRKQRATQNVAGHPALSLA